MIITITIDVVYSACWIMIALSLYEILDTIEFMIDYEIY